MQTVQEWEAFANEYTERGDVLIDALASAPIDPFIDQVRDQVSDFPFDNEFARLTLENSALIGLHMQALFMLILGMSPDEVAGASVHELVHKVWRKVAEMQVVGNLVRSALVDLHHATTGDPLPPTPNEQGDTDFEFWNFQRELEGKEPTIQAAVTEALDAIAQLKTLAGIDPAV